MFTPYLFPNIWKLKENNRFLCIHFIYSTKMILSQLIQHLLEMLCVHHYMIKFEKSFCMQIHVNQFSLMYPTTVTERCLLPSQLLTRSSGIPFFLKCRLGIVLYKSFISINFQIFEMGHVVYVTLKKFSIKNEIQLLWE